MEFRAGHLVRVMIFKDLSVHNFMFRNDFARIKQRRESSVKVL